MVEWKLVETQPHSLAKRLRFDRAELGGALGDLGVFIPLLVGMVNRCGLQFGPALFCAGLMNLVSGLIFGIPIPVQPMKAIAAVAIGEGLTHQQVLTAGIATGAVILVLTLTGLIDWLNRAIPQSVVRGLQLGLGLKLLIKGVEMITDAQVLIGWDSIGLGILCTLVVLMLYGSTRIPAALLVFAIGLIALVASQPALLSQTRLGMTWTMPVLSDWSAWRIGVVHAALPQIPLTTLNSVIAVCALSRDLFPNRPAAPRRVAISVALMNLVCCPLGGMPVCHGSGGLAAQYRFGARTGGSIVMLGVAKMGLALLLGGSLLLWLEHYPQSVLGVLLLFSGVELALVCRDQSSRIAFFVMIITAGVSAAANMAVGFLAGWAVAILLVQGVMRIAPPADAPNDPSS
ncbi:MAG: putative sulfate/molybdate transporter [Phycisphaerales bacterium]|nr:MAG: putative sulfate/molybdate transporter [Phycisphaerales bacterium]